MSLAFVFKEVNFMYGDTTYVYTGAVLENGVLVCNNWYAKTTAITKKKALSNLAWQYKNNFNRPLYAKITLPGSIKEKI